MERVTILLYDSAHRRVRPPGPRRGIGGRNWRVSGPLRAIRSWGTMMDITQEVSGRGQSVVKTVTSFIR